MPAPPNTGNYQVGGAIVSIGGIDLGNIKNMEIDPTGLEVLEHYTSRTGARQLDRQIITQKKLTFRFDLDEHASTLYRLYFMANGGGLLVNALQAPLTEMSMTVTWLNESATIWSYSHSRVTARPSQAMGFGEFRDWVPYTLEVEALQDLVTNPTYPLGRFTFVA